ncbi:MAG TPA: hypothetical protein VFA85_08480 [Terriglobales bacterium]|nr:hypothetical protein [Terriglobales bacterium]
MVTDQLPRNRRALDQYLASERLTNIDLPPALQLRQLAQAIECVMADGTREQVRVACANFLAAAAAFYGVRTPEVRALAARPRRVREGWQTELFGDYWLADARIRIWTRTAVRKQVTSFGTFLSTLSHEFCHHLDCQKFGFRRSPHTRGFYERAALLYHHARGTPVKKLFWVQMPGGRWRIDWRRTNAVQQIADQIRRFSSRSYSGK